MRKTLSEVVGEVKITVMIATKMVTLEGLNQLREVGTTQYSIAELVNGTAETQNYGLSPKMVIGLIRTMP